MRVFLDSVGCRLNQSEIELLATDLRQGGAQLVGSPEVSEVMVLNTCAVTQDAVAGSRRQARRMHRRSPRARLILTGCWATLDPSAALQITPEAQAVPNAAKHAIASLILGDQVRHPEGEARASHSPIPGRRHRLRGFIKAQEGCDSTCAFCLTRLVRGPARSIPPSRVLQRVQQAISGGAREIVLCGVQLGAYGKDLGPRASLEGLIRLILGEMQDTRLRLSSIEPWDVSDGLLALWQDQRLCRQLHLPLQSGCDATLRRMLRPIAPAAFARLAARARAAIPGLALTTDLMAGFPGESEAEFDESLRFIEAIEIEGAHVFSYSPRPGTLAAQMPAQVHPAVARRRVRTLRAVASRARHAALARQVGMLDTALWVRAEPVESGGWLLRGLTGTGFTVCARSRADLRGACSEVHLAGVHGAQMEAVLLLERTAGCHPAHGGEPPAEHPLDAQGSHDGAWLVPAPIRGH